MGLLAGLFEEVDSSTEGAFIQTMSAVDVDQSSFAIRTGHFGLLINFRADETFFIILISEDSRGSKYCRDQTILASLLDILGITKLQLELFYGDLTRRIIVREKIILNETKNAPL